MSEKDILTRLLSDKAVESPTAYPEDRELFQLAAAKIQRLRERVQELEQELQNALADKCADECERVERRSHESNV